MSLAEPMTFATDMLLAIAAFVFSARLWRVNRMWALAFLFTGFGSFFGGTHHGFAPMMSPLTALLSWKATVFSIGIASFFLLAGSHRKLQIVAIMKLIVYISWMITHNDFVYVIVDYGLTLLIVGIVVRTRWVLGSIVLSVLGALVQQSTLALPPLNHNDIYHVIQLIALWLLYRGGRLMNRSTAPPTTQPT